MPAGRAPLTQRASLASPSMHGSSGCAGSQCHMMGRSHQLRCNGTVGNEIVQHTHERLLRWLCARRHAGGKGGRGGAAPTCTALCGVPSRSTASGSSFITTCAPRGTMGRLIKQEQLDVECAGKGPKSMKGSVSHHMCADAASPPNATDTVAQLSRTGNPPDRQSRMHSCRQLHHSQQTDDPVHRFEDR